MDHTLVDYKSQFPHQGRLEWIGVSSAYRSSIQSLQQAVLETGLGIENDYHARSGKSDRQVTLIQEEHFPILAELLGREKILPEELRRNLVVSKLNLLSLKKKTFEIGHVVLEGVGNCAPCSRMEENLGPGGYNAMIGHGGITAKVLQGGTIQVGDQVRVLTSA